ncbi:MAG TPA: exodeoxyribonuclease VII large subunit [Sphingobacteriaceae bacterium]|nr:exodeoxyribonuclease VII large subunit [Sphingobacteriaceae bacterium]
MPEIIDDKTIFSLFEVARSVRKTLATRYTQSYWISAELNKLNFYKHSGHCYPDLVEKKDGKIIAEMRSTLWKADFQRINKQFKEVTKEPLKDGIGVLIQATISYDELYGLSLRIIDIDPNFSLGVLAREKQEAIDRLRKEQIFDLNRSLPFPLLPKRIALISVETSKGLADFLKILQNNVWNYRFEFLLFPALLQGDRAVSSILAQIEEIKSRIHEFDAVALIRGGGGDVGLSCYNQFELASAIAKFPIPFLTGIGHATNETVSEMVAYKNAITPSELADFLIQHFHNFSVPVLEAEKTLVKKAEKILDKGKSDLEQSLKQFRFASQNLIRENRIEITNYSRQLKSSSFLLLKQSTESLSQSSRQVSILSPKNILKRGFSITYVNGKALMSASEVQKDQEVITVLADGKISSIVKEINSKDDE